MAKVTSKLQVTVPRRIAEEYGIRPGDEIDWMAAGDVIRVIPTGRQAQPSSRESQLRWFDPATERHSQRLGANTAPRPGDRGWKREDLYGRGRTR
jgi:bifunctional DNA-binding transcriptional regulator/antitoxin component of YhaV-PrlF toxin-antitoxin module